MNSNPQPDRFHKHLRKLGLAEIPTATKAPTGTSGGRHDVVAAQGRPDGCPDLCAQVGSECGDAGEFDRLNSTEVIEQGRRWLQAGAGRLVIEARESPAVRPQPAHERSSGRALRGRLRVRAADLRGADHAPPIDAAGPRRPADAAIKRAPGGVAQDRDLPPGAACGRVSKLRTPSRRTGAGANR